MGMARRRKCFVLIVEYEVVLISRVAHNRIEESVIINKCEQLGLKFIRRETTAQRMYVVFVCPKHEEMGEQKSAWYHFKDATKGCKYCCGKNRTTESFKKEIAAINPDVEIIGEYKRNRVKIQCRCKVCGNEYSIEPMSLLQGSGCAICGLKKRWNNRRVTTEGFQEKLDKVQPDIKIIGEYTYCHTLIKCECIRCGYVWNSYPANLLNGSAGCPSCRRKISKGERAVSNYLDAHDIEYVREYSFPDCKNIFALRFDFYLPEYNTLIEYDGQQHYRTVDYFCGSNPDESLKQNQIRDGIKDDYCKQHGYTLIRIPYFEYRNIQNILDDKLIKTKQSSETVALPMAT